MSTVLNKSRIAILVAAACLPLAANATNGIMQAGNGMVAHGFGGAGIANAAEATSLADNPALAGAIGNQGGAAVSLFNPNRSANIGAGYVESDSKYFWIPQGAYVSKMDEKQAWGIAAYAMGGMNTDYPAAVTGGTMPIGVDLSGLIVAPSYSYKASPSTSVGAAILLGYAKLKMTNLPALFSAGTAGETSDSATGWGVKLGVTSEVSPGTTLAFTYQPKMNMKEMKKFCDTGGVFIFMNSSGGCNEMTLPNTYSVGTSTKVGAGKIVADITRLEWEKVDLFKAFGWKNQTVFKAGYEFGSVETQYRVGFNYGKSPIDGDHAGANFAFPAVTETHLTFGFSHKMSAKTTISGYYLRAMEKEISDTSGGWPAGTAIKMNQNAIGVGFNTNM